MKGITEGFAVKDIYGYWLAFSGDTAATIRSHQTRKSDPGAADLFETEEQARYVANRACETGASVEFVKIEPRIAARDANYSDQERRLARIERDEEGEI